MKVDTMRHIDYYVGIPLCFIGSLCQKIVKLFTGSEKKLRKMFYLSNCRKWAVQY